MMDNGRRNFIRGMGSATVGLASWALTPRATAATSRGGEAGRRWGMVVDARKCIGCQACTVACTMENDVPLGKFRTIVSTYEVAENGAAATYVLPRLCNHCDDPPCVPVCPVSATYQQQDGIVLVDNTRCVGCGYCVQACPYDARFINPKTQTADKCTFCAHRVAAGLLPGCVETCVGGARNFGDLNDPQSVVSRMLADHQDQIKVLKPELKTHPYVFYIGLDTRFQGKVRGERVLWHAEREASL